MVRTIRVSFASCSLRLIDARRPLLENEALLGDGCSGMSSKTGTEVPLVASEVGARPKMRLGLELGGESDMGVVKKRG
jgi:hypothetical protein